MPSDKTLRTTVIDFLKVSSAQSSVQPCPDCGLILECRKATFFFERTDLGNTVAILPQVRHRHPHLGISCLGEATSRGLGLAVTSSDLPGYNPPA